jgi:error-prone DNA polymerase
MEGPKLVARWRYAGAWWCGESQTETVRWLDSGGAPRERTRSIGPVARLDSMAPERDRINASEDLDLQLRPGKTRDEKVGRACGWVRDPARTLVGKASRPYAPLHVLSGYSFGRSVLLAEEIGRLAAMHGLPAVAIADVMALTGAHELAKQCRMHGVKPIVSASFEMPEGGELVLAARDAVGWRSLSRLVTACHLDEPRLHPLCRWERLALHAEGLLCLTGGDVGPLDRLLARGKLSEAATLVDRLIAIYGREQVFLEVDRAYLPWSMRVESRLRELAVSRGLRLVAGGAVTHARREHFPAQDVLTCAQTLCLVDEVIGRKPARHGSQPQATLPPVRSLNGERFLRTPDEMKELYADAPDLLDATLAFAERVEPDVLPGPVPLPRLHDDPDRALRELTFAGARERYRRVTPALTAHLTMEIDRFGQLGYSSHALLAHDLCRWARDRGILFSARGSAVDSAVLYALGVSRIDAYAHRLHFDRFLPEDGTKIPDIDIDFEARRRDDVHEYLIRRFGVEHVSGLAAIGSLRSRGIVREAGKALGLPEAAIGMIAKRLHAGIRPEALADALERRPELKGVSHAKDRLRWVFHLAHLMRDVPRGMRSHSSGVIVSGTPIRDVVPVQRSGGTALDRIIQWDKRSAKRCFVKFDLLCLRGQDVLGGTQDRLREAFGLFDVEAVEVDDPDIYRAMRSGQTVGIPQSASPAMTQAHARIGTENLADASLVQAGIRPGVGGAVKLNTLIARRRGATYEFDDPEFERILGPTYGVIVFQEQVDQLLQVFCGFSGGQAEEIRESIHEKRWDDYGGTIKDLLIERAMARGFRPAVATQAWEYIAGFKGYGFAQGHALAFAEISARSVWCQQNYPAAYFAALLDAQPAGYYGPSTLVNEARSRGLRVLPPDVNLSTLRVEVEDVVAEDDPRVRVPAGGIRLDLGTIAGLSVSTRERIVAGSPYDSVADFARRARPRRDELEQLILCGALDGLHPNRRALLWGATKEGCDRAATKEAALPLGLGEMELPDVPDFSDAEKALHERTILGLDVTRHLMAWERDRVREKRALTTSEAKGLADGESAMLVGNPIRLRFPPTPSGKRVVFFDLEDETGLLNVTCFDQVYRAHGEAIVLSPYVVVFGRCQRRDDYPAFLADRVIPYRPSLLRLAQRTEVPLKTADFLVG